MEKKMIMCLLLICLLAIHVVAATSFVDVQAGKWYSTAVMYCAENGHVSGYSDGTFKPNNTITRAELAAVMNKMLKLSAKADNHFTDVPSGKWYTDPILNCVNAGIITGYSTTKFGPNDKVTREQAAVILSNAFEISKTSGRTSFTDDAQIASWAKGSVKAMASAGLISGVGNNTFAPKSNVTRAAICQMIYAKQSGLVQDNLDFEYVSKRYKEASNLYCNTIVYQGGLDHTDTITRPTSYGETTYYRVPHANTLEEFTNYCRQYYTAEIVDEILGFHKFVEKDGKLYMDQSMGVGGPSVTEVEMKITKISGTLYTISLLEFYDGDRVLTSSTNVHLIYSNGYWVWDDVVAADDSVICYEITG